MKVFRIFKNPVLIVSSFLGRLRYKIGIFPLSDFFGKSPLAYFFGDERIAPKGVVIKRLVTKSALKNNALILTQDQTKFSKYFPTERVRQPLLEYKCSHIRYFREAFFIEPNVFMGDLSYVYGRRYSETEPYKHPTFNALPWKNKQKFEGLSLSTLCPNGDTFYHWFVDSLSRLANYFVENKSFDGLDHILVPGKKLKFKAEFYNALGIKDKVHYIDNRDYIEAEELIAYNSPRWAVPEYQLLNLQCLLLKTFPVLEQQTKKEINIFVYRSNSAGRNIFNQSEIQHYLENLGYIAIDLENLKMVEQAKLFRKAKNVVSIHGSAQANLFYSQYKKGSLIELFGKGFINPCYYYLASRMGWKYGAVFGDTKQLIGHSMDASFTLNLEYLQDVMNQVTQS